MPPADDRHRLVPGGGWLPFPRDALERGIPARFAEIVRRHPDRPALRTADDILTYAQLAARAWRIARAVLARRGDASEPVALLLDQGADLVAAILGTLAAGKIYVPLDPAHADARNRVAITDAEPALVLTLAARRAAAMALLGRDDVLVVDALDRELPGTDPALPLSGERPACLYYTSGSTGRPKGVVDAHRNVLHNILRYTDSLRIGCDDRLSLVQGPAFSGAVSSLFAALLNGACSHPVDLRREGFGGLARRIAAERMTMLHAVPSIVREVCAAGGDLGSLRVVRLEGDASSDADLALFQRRCGPGCLLVNGLGATETGLSCQYFVAPDRVVEPGPVPVGYAAADVTVEIVDGTGRPAAAGAIGELIVASPYLALGYWRNPALTEARFFTGPDGRRRYRTGDLARRLADGAIVLRGRHDEQLRVDGEWLDLPTLEAALCRIDGVAAAAVAVRRFARRLQLIAYVVPAEGVTLDPAAVRRRLPEVAPLLRMPALIEPIAALPLDANGKVARQALPPPRPRTPPPLQMAAFGAVLGPVLGCWRQVLQRDDARIDRAFAEEGGDSFAALQLAMLLEERLGRPVPPDLIRAGTTVVDLARALARPDDAGVLCPLAHGGDGRAIFLIHGVGGHLQQLVPLAERLAFAGPVYGLRFPDMGGDAVPPADLAGLARHYAGLIREREPFGPYTVGGNCLGGLLALEVARCLVDDGERVGPVLMIETAYPDGLHRPPAGDASSVPGFVTRIRNLPAKLKRHAVGGAWELCRLAGLGLPPGLRDAHAILVLAARRYRPSPVAVPAIHVSLGESPDAAGWARIVTGGLERVVLPRLAEPAAALDARHVDALATALRERLRRD
ncbi:MAG: AMP-binding protein [Geminicoccaceae bacterium]